MMYLGWYNRQTWIVYVWLTNDEQLYRQAIELAKRGGPEEIRDFVEQLVVPQQAGISSDLLSHALGEVRWAEIANQLRELADS